MSKAARDPRLTLRDLVLFNICAIASLRWIPAAAHAGLVSLVLFVVAALLFLLPLGTVVGRLVQRFPERGGLYAWTRHTFGPRHAFLCAWLYFISNLFYFPSLVLFAVGTGAYMFGGHGPALSEQRVYAIPGTLLLLWALFAANFFGIRVARFVQMFGAAAIVFVPALLIAFAVTAGPVRAQPGGGPNSLWDEVNLFSLIAFAFVGLELAPVLGGEIRNPARDVPRSALIAGAVCVVFYVSGTGALLQILPSDIISPLTGLVQAGVIMGSRAGMPTLSNVFAAIITLAVAAQLGTWIAGNTRLPYVIGLDRYLPPAFARLHPRWRTPHISLLFQAIVATLLLLLAQFGESVRATYQILLDMLIVATFLPFLYIFACGWRHSSKWAAASGFLITLLSIALSFVPPSIASSRILYETKVVGGVLVVIAAGILLYRHYEKRRIECL